MQSYVNRDKLDMGPYLARVHDAWKGKVDIRAALGTGSTDTSVLFASGRLAMTAAYRDTVACQPTFLLLLTQKTRQR